MSLQQIAWLLGYSEIGAFNHAFKTVDGDIARPSEKSDSLICVGFLGVHDPQAHIAGRPVSRQMDPGPASWNAEGGTLSQRQTAVRCSVAVGRVT